MKSWNVQYELSFTLPCPKVTGLIKVFSETCDLASTNAEAQIMYKSKYTYCGTVGFIKRSVKPSHRFYVGGM